MSGLDNLKFICRVYGLDFIETCAFVDDFTELGRQMGEPVKTYYSGMRARLAFGLTIAIEFDCYLINEVIMVGDQRFFRRCQEKPLQTGPTGPWASLNRLADPAPSRYQNGRSRLDGQVVDPARPSEPKQ